MTGEYEAFGRARARREGEIVTTAVVAFERTLRDRGVDRERVREDAEAIEAGLPAHLQREFYGFVAAHPLVHGRLSALAFGLPAAVAAIEKRTSTKRTERTEHHDDGESAASERESNGIGGGGGTDDRTPTDGCTLVCVSAERTAGDRPLVAKSRDVKFGRVQPQRTIEYPAMAGRYGFATVTTCGSVLCSQGVNESGLIVANTFVDRVNENVAPTERIRTPVAVRRLLETCETVGEATGLVCELPTRRLFGCAIALADTNGSVVLDVDPVSETVRRDERAVVVRTNHFGEAGTNGGDHGEPPTSSSRRRERAQALVPERGVRKADLRALAADHDPEPGPDSICRHARVGEPTEWETVSATCYWGGKSVAFGTVGAPCENEFDRIGGSTRPSR